MQGVSKFLVSVALFGVVILPAHHALAWPDNNPEKVLPDSPLLRQDAKPAAPDAYGGLTKELFELRRKTKANYNEWLKEDTAIQKECAVVRTPLARAQCDQKKKLSQAKLDIVHAKTRDMLRKVDTYRRQQAGLPPSQEWLGNGQNNGANGAASTNGSQAPKLLAPLLPSNAAPVPTNTY
jgi:hypothetical protein